MRNKILEKSKKTKQIIGIRLYGEDDDFWLGYIENFNDKIIQLRYFDRLGIEDGIVIEQQENIESIDYDSDYEKTYEYLINKQNDFSKIEKIVDFKDSDNWKMEYLSVYKTKKEILSIKFSNDLIIDGYILEITDSEFIVESIGHIGEDEGKGVYKISDITAFRLSDKKSKLKQELNKWRKKK